MVGQHAERVLPEHGRQDPTTAALTGGIRFRGYLLAKLDAVFDRVAPKVVANAALFAWLHVIYPDPVLSVSLTCLAGLGFAAMSVRYPNLWLAAASHAVLNCLATAYCFVNLEGACPG